MGMTAAIHVLREALLQASDLDPSVLDELESHYRTGDEPLVELFQFYGQLVPTAPDPERIELIRSRLLAFLVEVVDGEKTAVVRGSGSPRVR